MILCTTLMRSKYRPPRLVMNSQRARLTHFVARYDFEYEDADEDEAGDIGIENKYYNAKQIKVDNPEEAIDEFLGVPALEQDKGDWYIYILSSEAGIWMLMTFRGFKGMKQAIKLEFKLGRYSDVSWPLPCSLPSVYLG